MLSLIVKSYLTIFVTVGIFSFFVFTLALLCLIKTKKPSEKINKNQINNGFGSSQLPRDFSTDENITAKDLACIAGEDKIATQLDLARAYIETGKLNLAKKILETVRQQGSNQQKKEAETLFMTLSIEKIGGKCELR